MADGHRRVTSALTSWPTAGYRCLAPAPVPGAACKVLLAAFAGGGQAGLAAVTDRHQPAGGSCWPSLCGPDPEPALFINAGLPAGHESNAIYLFHVFLAMAWWPSGKIEGPRVTVRTAADCWRNWATRCW
jgi:hypothetical protein